VPDSTHDVSRTDVSLPDRDGDPSDGWIVDAVHATTLAELQDVARAARRAGALTPRDQAWCRALAGRLADVDNAAMALLVRELVTGNGSAA
jgi:hypothetical protein